MPTTNRIDRIDQRILTILQSEGRINNLDLAEKIGLSPTPCARRVRLLEQRGVIVAYAAVVDTTKLGMGLAVLVHVHLDSHSGAALDAFEHRIQDMPEILEAYAVTGSHEYLLKVVAQDLRSYSTFQRQKLLAIPHVLTVDSLFILRHIKRSAAVTT